MSLKETILKERVNALIEDIYSVADELEEYLQNTHKSKVSLAKAMKNVRQSYRTLEDEIKRYKRYEK